MKRTSKPWAITVVLGALLLSTSMALAVSAAGAGLKLVHADNPDYVYAGRVDFSDPAAPKFYWAGNSATIGFTGRGLAVVLDSPKGDVWFDVVVDGDGAHRHVVHCRSGRHAYVIATHLADGRHTVEVFRRVDPTAAVVMFEGIEIGKQDTVFRPALRYATKIEYYGDSITSGFGVLAPGRKDEGNLAYMDNYVAYDADAARALHADYRSISLSGIGILKSWFPLVMPQMYDRLAPRDPASHWNFSRWTPDIVVINLLQNDSVLLPRERQPPSRQQIIGAYVRFVRAVRARYQKASIICMLGNMDVTKKGSPWPSYVEAAVKRMRADGDHRIHALIVPFKNTPGHPDVEEQKAMARLLVRKIKAIDPGA